MPLSRTVSYGVRATLQLAQLSQQGPVPCSRLAADGKMPERFLLQILRNLVTHGILCSTRGVDGGYALVRGADEISLLDVIEAIDGPYDSSLEIGNGLTGDFQNQLRDELQNVTTTTRRQLESIKLSQLVKPSSAKGSAKASDNVPREP
jgi:Rrf2 family protein